MRMKLFLVMFLIFSCSMIAQKDLTNYVDPFIGTGGHAHTYPGATMPFGMVQLSPDTDTKGWDWCSGYHYSDSSIIGFSHTHLSGTGASDYGDILFMPTTGEIKCIAGTKKNPDEGYRSRFSHEFEKASPGFYKVKLLDYKIDVELTVTERTGFHKYTFPKNENANIIIDLQHGIFDNPGESEIEIIGDNAVQGFRRSHGWASDHKVFFYAEFSKPFISCGIIGNNEIKADIKSASGKNIKSYFNFNNDKGRCILVKVGISAVSIDGAKRNLYSENPDWDFKAIKNSADEKWNASLSKIEIDSPDEDSKKIFYTALYHSMLAPNLFNDVDGKYRGMDNQIHSTDNGNVYTVFSLWDTYRASHPLFTIIEQERTSDFINSLISKYETYGLLPVWELAANETNCMIGYHSVPVIVDAFRKGIKSFDKEKAFSAMKASGEQDIRGSEPYRKFGYIPSEVDHEGVSRTLEYAYDDWCIAMMAKELGQTDEYDYYINRAANYRSYFDPVTGFMRPKQNGQWREPFDPFAVTSDFTEANSWQYSFYVPQDVQGMIEIMGGNQKFISKLDELFSVSSKFTGRHQSDITGLIGQYAHGNEPSHHAAYLFNYAGAAWRTQKIVRTISDSLYKTGPEGLSGNDDCGQLSAWYVLSALGFYPVCPGETYYVIGSPVVNNAKIYLENGKTFEVQVENNSDENIYVQSITLNGNLYSKSYIEHSDIINGGEICFNMGPKPNIYFGIGEGNIPVSSIPKMSAVIPFIASGESLFNNETLVTLASTEKEADIYYSFSEESFEDGMVKYNEPIRITESKKLKIRSFKKGFNPSPVVEAKFFKLKSNLKIELSSKYHDNYPGLGENTLIDGIRGLPNYRTSAWQGYEGTDLEAVIDFGERKNINNPGIGMYQEKDVWIFLPEYVTFSFSKDGQNYTEPMIVKNETAQNKPGKFIQDFIAMVSGQEARYVKVFVKALINCPDWHVGAGKSCFFFADEIFFQEN